MKRQLLRVKCNWLLPLEEDELVALSITQGHDEILVACDAGSPVRIVISRAPSREQISEAFARLGIVSHEENNLPPPG